MPIIMLRPEEKDKKDILAAKFEIEHEDVYHMKNLYKRVYEWLVDEGFTAAEGPSDTLYETLYWERTRANDSQEHHIWWRAVDTPRNNAYYRYFLKIDFQTINMKKIEIMHKGQKFGTNKGDVIIRVEGWLQLDYNDQWKKSGILSMFEQWFRERFYLADWRKYKDDLYLTTYRLHTTIKQYLQFKMTTDWGRSFHPERGV
jgi:hypothetical protein